MRAQRTKLPALLLGENLFWISKNECKFSGCVKGRQRKRKRRIYTNLVYRSSARLQSKVYRTQGKDWNFARLCLDCWRILSRPTTKCLVSKCKMFSAASFMRGVSCVHRCACSHWNGAWASVPHSKALWRTMSKRTKDLLYLT